MRVIELLIQIRPILLKRAAHRLSRGEGLREMFLEELGRFYDLVQQSVEFGDPVWLEPQLTSWIQAATLTELEQQQEGSITPLLNDLQMITFEVVRECCCPEEALDVCSALLPVFSHAFMFSSKQETDRLVKRISEDLERANAALERLDKSKSDFISVAAHELKTPLTLIEGYAAMLRESVPLEFLEEGIELYLKGIDSGSKRLREIIDDMIDVSLIDNNLLAIRFQPIWLNRLFEVIQIETQPISQQRILDIQFYDFEGSRVMTYGDGERLLQAFRNIINNAIKFTPDGGRIEIDGRMLPGFVEVTISDTGIGINPEDQAVIFEKFGRLGNVSLHSTSKTRFKGGGPGLGLAITKGIIDAHGGTIWTESPGYDEINCPGSTFHVLLPIYQECPDVKTARLFESLRQS